MNCPICGKEIKNNSKFCTYCGSSIYSNEPNIESKPVNITPQNQQPLPQAQKNPMPYLITVIIVVAIIAAAYVIVNLSGKDSNDNIDSDDELYYDATTEATTEADTPKVVEVPTAAETTTEAVKITQDYEPQFSDLAAFMTEFYSYSWVNTTNNHDPSYVAANTVPDSPAYNMLGVRYWQERPGVTFKRIYDVTIDHYEELADGSYDVYVYYTYEYYNSSTGGSSHYIELSVDNIVYDSSQNKLLMYDHTWKDNLPVGTTIYSYNFNK